MYSEHSLRIATNAIIQVIRYIVDSSIIVLIVSYEYQ